MDKSKGSTWITIICIIIGIMIALQMKSIGDLGGLVTTQRADEMLIEINEMEKEKEKLIMKVNELEDSISIFENQAADNNDVVEKMLQDTSMAKAQAGYTDLVGPGVVVTLDYTDDDDFDPFTFNSELLLLVVNELNASGAEAIAINEERIVNSSEIRLAGNHININGKKNAYPFVFKVIGDAKTLSSALNIRGGIFDLLELNYIEVTLEESNKLTVPKYSGTLNFTHAKPVDK